MQSIAVTVWPEAKSPVINPRSIARSKPWLGFQNPLFPIMTLISWLGLGGFITWLLADFSRALDKPSAFLPPWSVFSLFVVAAVLVWRFWSGKNNRCTATETRGVQ